MSDLAMSAMKNSSFTDEQREELEALMAMAFCQGMQYLQMHQSARLQQYHQGRAGVPVRISDGMKKQIDAAFASECLF